MKKTNKDDARDGKVSDHKVIDSNMRDAKWQLAINLYKLSDRKLAIEYLNILAKDKDEYVRRRASSELVK